MTVARLLQEITVEELLGWSAYFSVLNEEQEEQMRRARRGRR